MHGADKYTTGSVPLCTPLCTSVCTHNRVSDVYSYMCGVYLIPAGNVVILTLLNNDDFAILHVLAVRLLVSIPLCT